MKIRQFALAIAVAVLAAPLASVIAPPLTSSAWAQNIMGDPSRGQALMLEMKCPKCHGQDGRGQVKTPGVPRIDGQYETYLVNQLFNFRDGRRPHKFMEIYAGRLDGQTVRDLAAFYACQNDGNQYVSEPGRCATVR